MKGWSQDELLHEVLVSPRRAFVPYADMRVIERPGWSQLITPSFKRGGLNEVSFSVLGDAEADAVIDATLAEYERLGLRFFWSVGPWSTPADLGARLERRGLKRRDVRGMVGPTRGVGPPGDPAIAVAEVTPATLEEFSQVMATGWSVDVGPFHDYHRVVLGDPAHRHHLFVARVAGVPAACATYVAFERSAYLMGGVVLPAFRGRGLYRALVAARLGHALARGLELATSQAQAATSAPLLEHFGFRAVCELALYANTG